MSDKAIPPVDENLPAEEPGAQERFDRAIKTALATPPSPHKPKAGSSNERRTK